MLYIMNHILSMCVCDVFLHNWKYFLNSRIQNTYISYVALYGNPTLHPM